MSRTTPVSVVENVVDAPKLPHEGVPTKANWVLTVTDKDLHSRSVEIEGYGFVVTIEDGEKSSVRWVVPQTPQNGTPMPSSGV